MNSASSKAACLLVILVSIIRLNAQQPQIEGRDIKPESRSEDHSSGSLSLHIDRQRYIAGEDIWFSIYYVEGGTKILSDDGSVVYTELLNTWNVPVIRKRFQVLAGRGEGHVILPDTLSSGTYSIRAYTNIMKNLPAESWPIYDIEVFNPFRETGFFRRVTRPDVQSKAIMPSYGKEAAMIISDPVYERRSKVSLNILFMPGKSKIRDMSLSVVPENSADTSAWRGGRPIPGLTGIEYGPEKDGHFLSGSVKYRNPGIADPSRFLYMSVQAKVAEFRYADIDSSGRFTFLLPVESRARNLILQPDHADENMLLELESPYSDMVPAAETHREPYSDSLLNLISGLSFNYQTARIYGTKYRKDPGTDDSIGLKKRRFYGIPEMEVFLDDYIKLPTMQEVFFELVPGIIIRSGRSGYEVKITNPLTGAFYEEKPLVMIDGVIINNLDVLVNLDPEMVEKIEVVKTPYLIGDLVLQGIVNVITRRGDFSDIEMPGYAVLLPYRVVENPQQFMSPDYSDEQLRLGRKPDLRNTLYWAPSIKTGKNGEASISFWTSDLPGRYLIVLKGICENGELIFVQKSFMVR